MLLQPNDKHIIANYHYVEEPRPDRGAFHPCSIEKFREQLAWLSRHFSITTVQKVFAAAQNNSSEKLCAVTFDDGLKDQYDNAAPILKEYRATATFFPITGTLAGFMPSTHKIHLLLSQFSTDELVDKSNNFLRKYGKQELKRYLIPKDHRITLKRKLRDDIATANLKETINILPNEIEEELLRWLFQELHLSEKKLIKELFMNEEELKQLAQNGFELGCHTHHHYALDTQSEESVLNELHLSKQHFEKITDTPLTLISYPHGEVNEKVITIIQKEGFTHGLSITRSAISGNDSPYLIPRYDVNDIVTYN